jgi:asparaginyl-tRNA synthetase
VRRSINEWGADLLQSEHERYLVENILNALILFDYPANIKAFYMRLNEDGKQFAPWTFFSLD